MKHERVAMLFLVIVGLGAVITTLGTMIASGIDNDGTTYAAWQTIAAIFIILNFIGWATIIPKLRNDEQNHAQVESDSSLD